MKEKSLQSSNQPDKVILDFHLSSYLDTVGKVIFLVLVINLIVEVVVCTLLKMGYFSYFLEFKNNIKLTLEAFIFETMAKTLLTWVIFLIYVLLYKKATLKRKKILVCFVVEVLTTIFVYGHWKYSYLSILYAIPVVITSPLGKKSQKGILSFNITLTAFYSILQSLIFKTKYNFLIATVSITAIVTFYFISSSLYISMSKALADVEKFFLLSTKLNEEIAHDYSTGALSKVTLHQDLLSANNFESVAFLDLDDFKYINDTKGHSTGDHILKNIVRCCNRRNLRIYRYGGDEFVILSSLTPNHLAAELEKIKVTFMTSSKTLFSCEPSFSAGVIPFNKTTDIDELLRQCDKAMYYSKNEGKNKITLSH